jgi:hypothetical protein
VVLIRRPTRYADTRCRYHHTPPMGCGVSSPEPIAAEPVVGIGEAATALETYLITTAGIPASYPRLREYVATLEREGFHTVRCPHVARPQPTRPDSVCAGGGLE